MKCVPVPPNLQALNTIQMLSEVFGHHKLTQKIYFSRFREFWKTREYMYTLNASHSLSLPVISSPTYYLPVMTKTYQKLILTSCMGEYPPLSTTHPFPPNKLRQRGKKKKPPENPINPEASGPGPCGLEAKYSRSPNPDRRRIRYFFPLIGWFSPSLVGFHHGAMGLFPQNNWPNRVQINGKGWWQLKVAITCLEEKCKGNSWKSFGT